MAITHLHLQKLRYWSEWWATQTGPTQQKWRSRGGKAAAAVATHMRSNDRWYKGGGLQRAAAHGGRRLFRNACMRHATKCESIVVVFRCA